MLVQDRPSIRGRGQADAGRPQRAGTRTVQRRVAAQPAAPRTYPPITWSTPSVGEAFAKGLSGILRSTLLLVLFAAALLASTMTVAVVIGRIIAALGFHPWSAY